MAKYAAIVLAIMVCVVLAESAPCDNVYKNLSPCRAALKQGGTPTASCCNGMKTLNSAATTKAARKSACECAKKLATSYKVNGQTASQLVKKCKVNLGYTIGNNVDCNKV